MGNYLNECLREFSAMEIGKLTRRDIKSEQRQLAREQKILRERDRRLDAELCERERKKCLRKAKYKVGQMVEYRMSGRRTVHFGKVIRLECEYRSVRYHIHRQKEGGTGYGFGNIVPEHEIVGAAL